jgi:hypothetical protein
MALTVTSLIRIDSLGKYYYCPLKINRLVDDTGGQEKYKPIEILKWSEQDLKSGKIITH